MAKKVQPAPIKVHITALEMTSAPKQSLPVPVNVHTAILSAPDIPLAFYRFLYRQVGSRWHWVDRLRMNDETLTKTLHDKRNSVTVLYVNGAPAGFFELLQSTGMSSSFPISACSNAPSASASASGSCSRPSMPPGRSDRRA